MDANTVSHTVYQCTRQDHIPGTAHFCHLHFNQHRDDGDDETLGIYNNISVQSREMRALSSLMLILGAFFGYIIMLNMTRKDLLLLSDTVHDDSPLKRMLSTSAKPGQQQQQQSLAAAFETAHESAFNQSERIEAEQSAMSELKKTATSTDAPQKVPDSHNGRRRQRKKGFKKPSSTKGVNISTAGLTPRRSVFNIPLSEYQNKTSPVQDLLKVYVYELPSDIGEDIEQCTIDGYLYAPDGDARTKEDYRAEIPLINLFRSFPGRTFDPDKADIYVVPYAHAGHCLCVEGQCWLLIHA